MSTVGGRRTEELYRTISLMGCHTTPVKPGGDGSQRRRPLVTLFVAEDEDGNIVGFANGGRERSGDGDYDAELYAIYLLDSHQRRGIGQALFRHVVQHLVEDGFRSMLIWVLAENPSCRFYESMGGIPIREQEIEIGGKRLLEIKYGWTGLEQLVN